MELVNAEKWLIAAAVVVIVVAISVALIQPYFEMQTFNKFTKGPKATYWDATFANLRVTAEGE